jgi:phosphoadenosine phosphosulfate reductase
MQLLMEEPQLQELKARFETESPETIVRWALCDSGVRKIAVASAFQLEGTCLIHMATRIRPDVPIVFLETGFHFGETLAFKERLADLLDLNVMDVVGDHTVSSQEEAYGPRLYERDPKLCCELNKVIPFNRALQQLDGWITGMRRDSAWTRRMTPILSHTTLDSGEVLLKVNPIANWTRREAWTYLKQHNLPHNPLYDLGFVSIGCAPCTRAVAPGEDERAGRWSGLLKTECGIHVRESRLQEEAEDDSDCPPEAPR